MFWYPFVGYSIFWLGLIASIIIYAIMRKWHPLMYFISICLYIFTVCFFIDIFDLSKNLILLVLAFPACLMIAVGKYLSTKLRVVKKR